MQGIYETAIIEEGVHLGVGVEIRYHAQVRMGAVIGAGTTLCKGVFVDAGVVVGRNCLIKDYVVLYAGVILGDGVFVGPHVVFTNDRYPRAIYPDGRRKTEYQMERTHVGKGATIGANATIRCGVTIGSWAMVGAGSVVVTDVPAYELAYGSPAVVRGIVDADGRVTVRLHDT